MYTMVNSKQDSQNSTIPLVFVHGWGAGVGFWAKNIDDLAKGRQVHMFDLMGFGQSSRPYFKRETADTIPKLYTQWMKSWLEKMNITDFILAGHSFGGFLATHYALEYPQRFQIFV